MPRNAAVSIENNFTKGLITEASGLNFPENACFETFDCIFDQKGTVSRRLGFDYETSYTLFSLPGVSNRGVQTFNWENVAGLGNLTFVVIQIGSVLYFYEMTATGALSGNKKTFTVDLDAYTVSSAPTTADVLAQFSFGNGDLFVYHPYIDTIYIEYDSDTDSISVTPLTLKTRDFTRQDDELQTEERPSTLSSLHKYNLYNQGWYPDQVGTGLGAMNPVSYWDAIRSDYPSNADIWWLFKDVDEKMSSGQISKVFVGNTPAPNGHYIVDAFYIDRSGVSGISGIDVESSSFYRPSTGAFFASRVFYAGVNTGIHNSRIYFSPVIESKNQYPKCYQSADPTSEEVFDLLPTDGGVVVIPEISKIIKLFPVQSSLLVFASNGVWSISGSSNGPFAANDYVVEKVSSINAVSHTSFVDVAGLPFWWNLDGIYGIQIDPVTSKFKVASATDQTIKSFYNDVPAGEISYVTGAYNSLTKVVQWLFRSTSTSTTSEHYEYNRVLNWNLLTQGFYPWKISDAVPYVAGLVCLQGSGISRESATVLTNAGDTVVDAATSTVIASVSTESQLSASFRYLTIVLDIAYKMTFSQTLDTEYVDWFTEDTLGTSYSSYGITGYKIRGEASKVFQSNYITLFSEVESGSSLWVQCVWDYATSQNTGRYSVPQQAYPSTPDTNYSVVPRRLRLRGQGLALQMKFYSEEGLPFNLVGWSAFETGNSGI